VITHATSEGIGYYWIIGERKIPPALAGGKERHIDIQL
jgi:hypothetical protein